MKALPTGNIFEFIGLAEDGGLGETHPFVTYQLESLAGNG